MTAGNWARLSLVIVLATVLQISVLDQIVVLDAHPDLLVVFPVAAALLAGPERGAIVGFVSGCAADLLVLLPYGLSPLTFVLVGFAVGMFASIPGSIAGSSSLLLLSGLGAAFATLVYGLIAALVGQKGLLGQGLLDAIITVGVGGFLLAPLALSLLKWAFSGSSRSALGLSVPTGGSATT